MKSIAEMIIDEAVQVPVSDIKDKSVEYAEMTEQQLNNKLKVNNMFIAKAVANKCGKLKPKVTSTKVSFEYDRRIVFSISFERTLNSNQYELYFSSIASYGTFKLNDDVFNIYEGIGELLRDTPTLELLVKYFAENTAMLRVLENR